MICDLTFRDLDFRSCAANALSIIHGVPPLLFHPLCNQVCPDLCSERVFPFSDLGLEISFKFHACHPSQPWPFILPSFSGHRWRHLADRLRACVSLILLKVCGAACIVKRWIKDVLPYVMMS